VQLIHRSKRKIDGAKKHTISYAGALGVIGERPDDEHTHGTTVCGRRARMWCVAGGHACGEEESPITHGRARSVLEIGRSSRQRSCRLPARERKRFNGQGPAKRAS
jgi:hypothetical protein